MSKVLILLGDVIYMCMVGMNGIVLDQNIYQVKVHAHHDSNTALSTYNRESKEGV